MHFPPYHALALLFIVSFIPTVLAAADAAPGPGDTPAFSLTPDELLAAANSVPPEEGDEAQIFLREMHLRIEEDGRLERAYRTVYRGWHRNNFRSWHPPFKTRRPLRASFYGGWSISSESVVGFGEIRTRHREHLTIKKIVPQLALALQVKVLSYGKVRLFLV